MFYGESNEMQFVTGTGTGLQNNLCSRISDSDPKYPKKWILDSRFIWVIKICLSATGHDNMFKLHNTN